MPRPTPISALVQGWKYILGAALIGALIALAFSFTQTLQYSSTIRLLITQPSSTSLDAYTVLKSNERIAQSLSQLLYTSTFFENILSQAPGVNAAYFPRDELSRRKLWQRSVETGVEANSGLMTVTVYHPDPNQARSLVNAAAEELTKQAPNYFGFTVRLQVIDTAVNSRWFARPNFISNTLFGLFLGLLVGTAWILVRKAD